MDQQKDYVVSWTIELQAETPRHAAEQALEIQRDPSAMATIFDVVPSELYEPIENTTLVLVDLDYLDLD